MNKAILLLGSNLGDRTLLINDAISHISKLGAISLKSSIYESEAWGFESNENFLNIAIEIQTEYEALDLLKELQSIENKMGRIRNSKGYSSRTMDIDILFFNSEMINNDILIVPHPRLHERMFTLKCLMDIVPEYNHPTLGKSIIELTKECTDNVKVWQI